jgi:hypothetical protein
MPALLTNASSLPFASRSTCARIAAIEVVSAMSSWRAVRSPRFDSIDCASASLRIPAKTLHPSRASRVAQARPMPEEQPLIKTLFIATHVAGSGC